MLCAAGHFARDCPTSGGRECRNCGQEGHMAKDCDQERKVTCRNCGKDGKCALYCGGLELGDADY